MPLPPLASFRFFNAAARCGSFVQAAAELHVTHGAVSRQVRQLEEALGVTLFERRNRAVFLTPAGQTLLNTTAPLFEQLEHTVQQLQQGTRPQALTVSCEPTIAMRWLIPRLPSFQQQHPDITLQLVAAGGPVDFTRSGIDLALRRDDFSFHGQHAEKICDEWMGPVCRDAGALSGGLGVDSGAKQNSELRLSGSAHQGSSLSLKSCEQQNSDLSLHGQRLLHSATRPGAWQQWQQVSGISTAGSSRAEYEHFYLCAQAALAGLGVAMMSFLMVQDELNSGQLVAPWGFVQDGSGYWLLAKEEITAGSDAGAFWDWVRGEVGRSLASVRNREQTSMKSSAND
ncbi:LysR family transcriptional regulator [Erwinia sp. E602]|uniref:LysR substrate-binding domain-containing protein n=1 Tax=Erwinia sp. E602 TaxID=2675378 RepID=UPI001BA8B481|nr:LysR substrate-binding domain-containing protein [Erwinia sp. E602]QUG77829.1 LysR family transcriptional regulator [Erwinia sp. E602]